MDLKRAILYGALFSIAYLLYQNWQIQFPPVNTPATQEITYPRATGSVPAADRATSTGALHISQKTKAPDYIEINTDVLQLKINRNGGTVESAKLTAYPKTQADASDAYQLFNPKVGERYIAKSGVLAKPDVTFTTSTTHYALDNGQAELVIPMTASLGRGVVLTKTYRLNRGSYDIKVDYQIKNQGSQPWSGQLFQQIMRNEPKKAQSNMFGLTAYTGAAISDSDNKKYEKVSFDDIEKANLDRSIRGGWAAMQEHYFLTAWVPVQDDLNRYYSHFTKTQTGDEYTIGLVSPKLTVAPGKALASQAHLYVGPELGDVLEAIAPGLDLTVDYGWLWFISVWIFWLMAKIHALVGNWGLAIISVTVIIKLLFFRLSTSAYRSMGKMRQLQPRMQALKERYGDDKAMMSQKTMELYRNEKINPLGGCLPMLVQIPVFIALYWVLLESVQLRHAPFIFWIQDLSAYDPYFVLPILMGLSMLWQQKLNPSPPDPVQAKVMMFLPILFTGLFLYFPSGLVLYMVVNNVISILHQWYVMYHQPAKTNAAKQGA